MAHKSLARLYLIIVAIAALSVAAIALWTSNRSLSQTDLILSSALLVLLFLATWRPLHVAMRANVDLATAILFALVLLYEPAVALSVTLVGTGIAHLARRVHPEEAVFNTAQATLQVGGASGILLVSGWDPASPDYADAFYLPFFAFAAVTMMLINTGLVTTVIGLQVGISPLAVFQDAVTRSYLLEQATQVALGLIGAIIAAVQPLILPALAFPALMVYVAVNRQSHLRYQTLEAVTELADLVDQRDPYTWNHSQRVAHYARELAAEMGLPLSEIEEIERAARVHDLGKLMIDSSLLSKRDPLTPDEWELFKRHPSDGVRILRRFPEFARATEYVQHHHERIDGHGYPRGVAGVDIPLGARILAVADAFDAMTSARPYREALPGGVVIDELCKHRGTQWDPAVVDAMFRLIDQDRIFMPQRGLPVVRDRLGVVHSTRSTEPRAELSDASVTDS